MIHTFFSTILSSKTFEIESGTLYCYSQKAVYFLKLRICGKAPFFGKAKAKLCARFKKLKNAHKS